MSQTTFEPAYVVGAIGQNSSTPAKLITLLELTFENLATIAYTYCNAFLKVIGDLTKMSKIIFTGPANN